MAGSCGGFDGGSDGVDGGFDGFDGFVVAPMASMASMVETLDWWKQMTAESRMMANELMDGLTKFVKDELMG